MLKYGSVLVLVLLIACGNEQIGESRPSTSAATTQAASGSAETSASSAASSSTAYLPMTTNNTILDPGDADSEPLPNGVRIETIAGAQQGLTFPVAIAFLPDGRWLVTEKGRGGPNDSVIHLFANGQKQPQPFATIHVDSTFERGLLGITADPQFNDNHYVYVYYSKPGDPVVNTTVRYTERDGVGIEPKVLFEAPVVTGAGNHNGGNLHFGPDGKLYISIGEIARPAFAQDAQSLYGKIHRINPDGTVPADNPFAPAPGYAYGLRNPFDFTFDSVSGNLWVTDNGPSCDDELHLVRRGENYGWGPGYSCGETPSGTVGPVLRWSDTEAVTGVLVYNGDVISAWKNSILICAYSSGALYRATLTSDRTGVTDVKRVALPDGIRCRTDVESASDGSVYLLDPPNVHRIVAP